MFTISILFALEFLTGDFITKTQTSAHYIRMHHLLWLLCIIVDLSSAGDVWECKHMMQYILRMHWDEANVDVELSRSFLNQLVSRSSALKYA